LVCASHQGVFLWDQVKGFQLIAEEFEGNKLSCNDATADAEGRFIFGNTFYGPECKINDYPLGKLFKIEKDGKISILEEGIHLSNGIGFSPDNKTLYLTDTVVRKIYAYDYNLNKGEISNRRVFVKVPENEGIPDGLTVDSEGYVWSAQWYGSCFVRYDTEGKVDRRVTTPPAQTSSLVFGGDDLTDIYVTSAALSVKLHCAPKGYNFEQKFVGGPVYRYNFGIVGKPEYFADIQLQKK
jgi:sugar lactone lactonase YvrE